MAKKTAENGKFKAPMSRCRGEHDLKAFWAQVATLKPGEAVAYDGKVTSLNPGITAIKGFTGKHYRSGKDDGNGRAYVALD